MIALMTRGPGLRIAATALIVGLLGGCGAAVGDGDVIDDWPEMAAAKPKLPPSQTCYQTTSITDPRAIDTWGITPKPCAESHVVETFHVGELPATVTTIPVLGDTPYRAAYSECEVKAKEFLGAEWYSGRLVLNLSVPGTRQWEGGGRWFKCELIETVLLSGDIATREGSLAGALTGAAPLAQRCGNMTGGTTAGTWEDLTPVDCADPHDAEFTGVFQLTGAEPPTDAQLDTLYENCWDVVSRYLNGTKDRIQVGYLSWSVADAHWKRGDNWARCYAWAGENKKMVGSVKGIGNAAPRR